MFCKYCGTQVPDGYICGCPDSQRAAQAAAARQAAQQQAPNAQYAPQQQAPNAQYAPQQQAPNAQYAPQQQAPQYAGQYNPNPQYGGQYNPNPQYGTQYNPNPQYAGQYNQYAQQPQQPQRPQRPAGPSFGQELGNAFKAMPATFNALKGDIFGTGANIFTGGIFAVGSFVLNLLAWLLVFTGIFGEVMKYLDGLYGTALLTGFLAWLIPTGLMLLIPLFGQLARKEKVDIIKCVVQAAYANLLPTVMMFVTSLFMLLSAVLGLILMLATFVLSIVIASKLVYKQLKNVDGLFGTLIVSGIVTVVTLVAGWILTAPIGDYVSMMLSGIL